jgi:glycosyltransferase involved in cell wall biosynthesis
LFVSLDSPGVRLEPPSVARIDVDFSLAIHNRTGKYFIGRDVMALLGPRLGAVYYGALAMHAPPVGLFGRVLGRLQLWQIRSSTGQRKRGFLRRRSVAPLLHLDPFTVPTATLRRQDAVLCHDIGPLTHPDLFSPGVGAIYRAIYQEIAAVGPHLAFVSETTKLVFDRLFPDADPASTRVIYPMLRLEVRGGGTPLSAIAGNPFLLTVGCIGSRKNQQRCIEAFERSGLARAGVIFVICGGPEPGADAVARRATATAGVHLLPYVTDGQLAWLYANALGFVLASLVEGFGIPVAEAIAAGLVPIVSRDSVLEEVAGPAALTVNPTDIDDIAQAMRRLCAMDDAEKRRRQGELGASIARFNPDEFASGWNSLFGDMIGALHECAPPDP